MSNGGAFATTVGCQLGDQIKAVASVSGAYYTACRQEQRTPSLLVAHSTEDRQAPFQGNTIRKLPQIPQYIEHQATERHCKMPALSKRTESTIYYTWIGCDDNSSLQFVVLKAQPHGWLRLPETLFQRAPSSAGYIWDFFNQSTYRG
jgi:poly(3-hydroxybutyrate) depolymerase